MSGHSKWATTKHRKAKVDSARGKVFTKLSKEIMVAAKLGGDNPEGNFRLRIAIEKARESNMPADNIKRAIQKGAGGMEGENYEEMVYEGYGPSGTAVIMELMTNNRNRTAGEIRHILDKNGGNLGETGCVSWMFDRLGYIEIEKEKVKMDEEEFTLYAIEKGVDDLKIKKDIYELYVQIENLENVRKEIINDGIEIKEATLSMIPKNNVVVEDIEQAKKVIKLLETLEDHDDVQNLYSNVEIPEEILEALE